MGSVNKRAPIFVYPDPIVDLKMLSGTIFLYFDRPIALTLPPLVSTENSFNLLSIIDKRKPEWKDTFYNLFNTWQIQLSCCNRVFETLNPLRGEHFINVWTVYPANIPALEKSNELIELSGLSFDALKQMINPINAPGELIRHILLEAFLEHDEDVNKLYNYCGALFKEEPLENLLVKSYILRLHFLNKLHPDSSLIITNYLIWNNLLNSSSLNNKEPNDRESLDKDVIAWEIFKNILSPKLDPLDNGKVEYITKLLRTHKGQIENLKLKCLSLADKLKQINSLDELPTQVIRLIKSDVEKDINELLELDKRALENFLTLIFSDEKTWIGLLSFISGIINGNLVISTGGAISTLSLVGSKAVQASSTKREKIRQSDYGLVYSIAKRYK